MPKSLHQGTPSVIAFDSRGLSVRTIAFHRADARDSAPLSVRINRQVFNTDAHLTEQWDPRLFDQRLVDPLQAPNQVTRYGLTGQVLKTESVDAGWRNNFSDAAGQLLDHWDGRGTYQQSEYDQLGRPTSVFEHVAGDASRRCTERFTYAGIGCEDAKHNRSGQMIRHHDQAGSSRYDSFGLLGQPHGQTRRFCTTQVPPDWPPDDASAEALLEVQAYATDWQHDALGSVIEQKDAVGHLQRFKVDIAGRPKASVLDDLTLLEHARYNAFGQVEVEKAGNGVITAASYSAVDGRLGELKATRPDGTLLQRLQYAYDPVGNIECIEDLAQPVQWFAGRVEAISSYTYDTLYQLTSATGRENASQTIGPALPGLEIFGAMDDSRWRRYTQCYAYDNAGNLTDLIHSVNGSIVAHRKMEVDTHSNRSLFKENSGVALPLRFTEGFDANGNQQALAPGQDMLWDARNQLRQVTQVVREAPSGHDDDVETYVYDGGGQRVRKVRRAKIRGGEQVSEVRYLPGLEIRTLTTGEHLHVVSTQAGRHGVRLLHWTAKKPDEIDNNQLRYSLSDHLGSSTLELSENAELISQESYYPYGGTAWWAARNAIEAKYKTVRYSGKERDPTGLYYYGFRYYAPWLQRWINPDPAGDVDGLNLYCMVRNSPVRNFDFAGFIGIDILNPTAEQRKAARLDKREASPVSQFYRKGMIATEPEKRVIPVSEEVWQRLELADAANRFTKALLPYGSGNQTVDVWRTRGASFDKTRHLRAHTPFKTEDPEYARAAIQAGAGNCGEHASVAFSLLSSAKHSSLISLVKANESDHAFVVIGDLNSPSTSVFVDPWVTFPTAHLGEHGKYTVGAIISQSPPGVGDPHYALDDETLRQAHTKDFPLKTREDEELFDKIDRPHITKYDVRFSISDSFLGVRYTYQNKKNLSYFSKNEISNRIDHIKRYQTIKRKDAA